MRPRAIDMRSSVWTRWMNVWTLIAVGILLSALELRNAPVEYFDTASYLNSWKIWSAGQFDALRTPVYPVILGTMQMLLGTHAMWAVCALQWALSIAGVCAMWDTLLRLGTGRTVAWLSLVLLVYIPWLPWDFNIALLTESLAISGMMALVWMSVRLWQGGGVLWGVGAAVLSIILVMLRPGMVYVLPVLAVMYGYGWWLCKGRRTPWTVALAMLVADGVALCAYCGVVCRHDGIFSPTRISTVNAYHSARGEGVVDAAYIDDPVLRDSLAAMIVGHGQMLGYELSWQSMDLVNEEMTLMKSRIGWGGINRLLADSYAARGPLSRVKGIFKRFKQSCLHPYVVFRMAIYAYLIAAVLWVAVARRWRGLCTRRESPWVTLLLLAMFSAGVAVTSINAPNDYMRLTYPVYPCLVLMMAQAVSWLGIRQVRLN